jgi:DNA-binding winged helix-turn-helix (wHTH) protein
VPKDEIASAVWPEAGGIVYDYQVDKLVSRLRERLRSPADAGRSPDETERMGHSSAGVGQDAGSADDAETEGLIETVWGYGYRLNI